MNAKKIIVPFLLISSIAFADVQVESIKKEKTSKDFSYNLTVPQFKFDGQPMTDLNGAFTNEILTAVRKAEFEGAELKKTGSVAKAEAVISFKEYKNSFGVTSVVTNNYSYGGGANGETVLSSYNIDNLTGKILTFDDVFIRSAKESIEKGILQAIKNNKSGKYFENTLGVNLDNSIMFFDGDYVYFQFQQYTIGPRSSGNPAFKYNKEILKPFFKYEFNK
ncbi:hypothetical protein I6E17_03440 [Fusobacterium perfoetens]|uniref:PdaC/SigV domain-containing protein n=1 Tax=Fusobacterium perfoetens TaxID=852 RepID=UPI001F1AD85E|nr:DUF4163 domain-containing protein [Fusobacterium perfoetens]MCF2625233.1 hypothetical protein [Fusobacterium perfoetens]